MEKFELNELTYDIIESSNIEDHHDFEIKKTSRTIKKKIFPIFPLLINGKFRWFKKCIVVYRLYITRRLEFDDGWSYAHYWSKWKREWQSEKIININ